MKCINMPWLINNPPGLLKAQKLMFIDIPTVPDLNIYLSNIYLDVLQPIILSPPSHIHLTLLEPIIAPPAPVPVPVLTPDLVINLLLLTIPMFMIIKWTTNHVVFADCKTFMNILIGNMIELCIVDALDHSLRNLGEVLFFHGAFGIRNIGETPHVSNTNVVSSLQNWRENRHRLVGTYSIPIRFGMITLGFYNIYYYKVWFLKNTNNNKYYIIFFNRDTYFPLGSQEPFSYYNDTNFE